MLHVLPQNHECTNPLQCNKVQHHIWAWFWTSFFFLFLGACQRECGQGCIWIPKVLVAVTYKLIYKCWTLVFDNSLLFNVHDGWHWWLKWSKTGQLGPFSNVNQLVAGNIFHILIAVVGCFSPGWAEQILRKSITQCPNHQRTHTPSVVFNPRKLNQITSVVLLQEQEWIKE